MATTVTSVFTELRKEWGWLLTIGILLIVLGVIALVSEIAATLASIVVFGAIIFIAGIAQIVGAFRAHGAGHIFLYLLLGILDVVVGLILLGHPVAGALVVTLVLATMFVVGGIFRVVSALAVQFPHYGWAVASGVITFILGIMLWDQFPTSALWFIGFAVGLNFIFAGISWTALALRLKNAPGA